MEFVLMLSQRLRLTSARLIEAHEDWSGGVPGTL